MEDDSIPEAKKIGADAIVIIIANYSVNYSSGPIKENPFKIEKEIQEIVESNLGSLFGLQLVRGELSLNGLRRTRI
ncbi:MAG TPA: hypothetical protein VNI77_04170 [Nitrososphaera sp.]|nr:hypothetical protein [Nitrososphaera sp.]